MRHSHLTTRHLVAALAFVAALIAAGFASPRAVSATSTPPLDGNVCGFSATLTNTGHVYHLYGTTGSVVTITVTSSVPSGGGDFNNGLRQLFSFSNVTSYTATFTLPDTGLPWPNFYVLSFAGSGTTTVSTSCGAQNISTDGRLNNDGTQGAQSVSLYCNSDGSIKMIPLQLKVPGPGSVSMKKAGTNDDLVLTSAKLSTIKQTTSYDDGITITPNSDGSWTVRRLELTTTKTYAYIIPAHSCGN